MTSSADDAPATPTDDAPPATEPQDAFAWIERAASDVVDAMRGREFLTPSGVLDLPVHAGRFVRLRVELGSGHFLHLQSIGLEADGVDDLDALVALTTVTASSWHSTYEERFDVRRLLDVDHPTGTVVHTLGDKPAWVELTFRRPLRIRRVRLRNVAAGTAVRARGLKVLGTTWLRRTRALYDGPLDDRTLREVLRPARRAARTDPLLRRLLPVLELTVAADYRAARTALEGLKGLDEAGRKRFRQAVNARLLPTRERLWMIHGPQRSFRFWTDAEKDRYLRYTLEVVDAIRSLTPNVSFGFGAVLSAVRDKALIPHDDDLDIIVAFEQHEATTLAEGLDLVQKHLEARGLLIAGRFTAHMQVKRQGYKSVDVFVGLFEGDHVSWYPGPRGTMTRDMVFPTRDVPLLGVPVPVPAQAEAYCEAVYGPTWNVPDPGFAHRWDGGRYSDISGKKRPPA